MKTLTLSLLLVTSTFASDWPQWRGPDKNNHAPADAKPVTEWSCEKNVRWKRAIPGRGHSTPIVVEGTLYLTTGEQEKEPSPSSRSSARLAKFSGKKSSIKADTRSTFTKKTAPRPKPHNGMAQTSLSSFKTTKNQSHRRLSHR